MTEKKKKLFSGRNLLILLGGLILCFALCLVFGSYLSNTPEGKATNTAEAIAQATQDALPTDTPEPPPTKEPTATTEPTLEPEEKLVFDIETVLGTGNREIQRLSKVFPNCDDSGCEVIVEWAINDNLSLNLIRVTAQTDATDILEQISQSDLNVNNVRLLGTFSMVDAYGNASEKVVVNLFFEKETIDKINFENFLFDNIYLIADTKDIHPDLIPE